MTTVDIASQRNKLMVLFLKMEGIIGMKLVTFGNPPGHWKGHFMSFS